MWGVLAVWADACPRVARRLGVWIGAVAAGILRDEGRLRLASVIGVGLVRFWWWGNRHDCAIEAARSRPDYPCGLTATNHEESGVSDVGSDGYDCTRCGGGLLIVRIDDARWIVRFSSGGFSRSLLCFRFFCVWTFRMRGCPTRLLESGAPTNSGEEFRLDVIADGL